MKNIIIIVCIILICFLIYICKFKTDVLLGYPRESHSIEQSIKYDLFISKYIPSKNVFCVDDEEYKIKEVFSEFEWAYKNEDFEIKKTGRKSFVICYENDWIDKIVYKRDNFSNNAMGYSRNKMVFNLTEEEVKKDTMKLYFFIKKDTIPVIFIKKKMRKKSFIKRLEVSKSSLK